MVEDLSSRIRALSPEQRELVLERLRAHKGSSAPPGAAAGDVGEPWVPLSTAQERFYFLDTLEPGNPTYNVPVTVDIRGPVDVEDLRKALAATVARHDALRCVFTQTPHGPRQRVTAPGSIDLPLTDLRQSPADLDRLLDGHARIRLDLASGPVLRAALFMLSETHYVLHVVVHHIAFDGWSVGLLVSDIRELYLAGVERRPCELRPLAMGFTDFARWEQDRQRGDGLAAHLRRSRDRLLGAPAALELPPDEPDRAVEDNDGGCRGFVVDRDVTARLADLARQESTTLYVALLSVFTILLDRASGKEEVVIGTPVAGRLRTDFEPVIGCFANTLVLRTCPGRARTFRELLGAVHVQVRDVFADQEVPYARLVEELAPQRVQGSNSLFQVMFGFADLPSVSQGSPGSQRRADVEFSLQSRDQELTDFEMHLSITRQGDALDATLAYSATLFHPDTIADFVAGYRQLLDQLSAEPDRELLDLRLLRRGAVALAATFTADPVVGPLTGWLRYLGLPADVELAPYGQVHQQLLARGGPLSRRSGLAAVLLRWEDWLRDGQLLEPDPAAIESLRANLTDLCEAVSAFRAATETPLLFVVCPPTRARADGAWALVFARLLDELAQACAVIADTRVIAIDGDSRHYPVAEVHDPHRDELASIPYTDEFFNAISAYVARHLWSLCAPPASAVTFAPGRLMSQWPQEDSCRFTRLLARQPRYGREVLLLDTPDDGDLEAGLVQAVSQDSVGDVIVLDRDPVVCSAVIRQRPGSLAVPVPATLPGACTALEHIWTLDAPGAGHVDLVPLFPSRIARIAERPGNTRAPARRVMAAPVQDATAPVAARTETELRLAAIWADLLDVPEVGVTTSFFTLGGHSLLAVKLLARVRDVFDRDVSLYDLFREPTVAHLARMLDEASAGSTDDELVRVGRAEVIPLSGTQRRLWALGRERAEATWHNMAFAVSLTGPLQESALRFAIAELTNRHEALRMVFPVTDNGERSVRVERADEAWMRKVFPPTVEVDGSDSAGGPPEPLLRDASAPFHLADGPLVRVRLFRALPDRHFLLIVMHHGVSDYWSWQVFFHELAELYAALRVVTTPLLSALELQFADYAHWQQRRAAAPSRAALLDRWRRLLAGAPPLLAMPTDFPRPAVRSGRSGRLRYPIDESLAERLRAASRHHGVTLFSVLLAGFAVIAGRCSGQDSCVVGVPVANRDRNGLNSMIGYLADLVPVRLTYRPDHTTRDLVREIHQSVSASRALAEVPLGDIIDAVNPVRVPGHAPLFQTALNFIDADEEPFSLAGLTARPVDLPPTGTEYDLFLSVVKARGGLTIDLEYSAELYGRDSATAFVKAFAQVLEALADEPDLTCDEVALPPGFSALPRHANPAAAQEPPPTDLIAIASSFHAAQVQPAVTFWSHLFGREATVAFAPDHQLFEQLLEPTAMFGDTACTGRVVLLRWEDLLRGGDLSRTSHGLNQVISTLERGLSDLLAAIRRCASRSAEPVLIGVCPPSAPWSAPPWTTAQAGLLRRLGVFCEDLDRVHVVTMEQAARDYLPVGAAVHDGQAGPYTTDFCDAMGTLLARWAMAAGTGYQTIVLDPARLFCHDSTPAASRHDDIVGWFLRRRGLAAGRRIVLADAGDGRETAGVRYDLLPPDGAIERVTVPGGPRSGPADRLAEAIRQTAPDGAVCVVLDPDPAVCDELRAVFPGLAAVPVPADPSLAANVLRHLWVLDGRPEPGSGEVGLGEVQHRILAEGLTSVAEMRRAAARDFG